MSAVSSKSYYDVLGVAYTASDHEIRVAYRRKALSSHPDKAAQNKQPIEKATAVFKLVNEAYETLSNPQKRKLYDMSRRGGISVDIRPVLDRINPEMWAIINRDNGCALDQYLRGKSFNSALLQSILHEACRMGKGNIAKYLIEVRKLSPSLRMHGGLFFDLPIFIAAAESGNLSLVKYLVEVQHVDIESKCWNPCRYTTALSSAALRGHEEVVKYLISKGAKVNPNDSLVHILNDAIESKRVSVVMLLVEAGTRIGDSDLGTAMQLGVLDIVQYLLQKRPGIKNHTYTSSPACMAVRSGNVALVKYLEEKEKLDILEKIHPREDSVDLLIRAAAGSYSIEMMRFLLDERGLAAKVSTSVAQSILIETVHRGRAFLTESGKQTAVKFVQYLMEERRFVLPTEKIEQLILDCTSYIEMKNCLQGYLRAQCK